VLGSSWRDTKLLTVVIAPTAQVSPLGSAATALSWADPNCGVVTTVQLVPFHCSLIEPFTVVPTAPTSLDEMAVTAVRVPSPIGDVVLVSYAAGLAAGAGAAAVTACAGQRLSCRP
jgi:hypothetical protein